MKRALVLSAFTLAVVVASIVLTHLPSTGMAQQPAPNGVPGRYSLVVSPLEGNDARLFFIDTQTGRIWWGNFSDSTWQEKPSPVARLQR
jgi:hypothetical protein